MRTRVNTYALRQTSLKSASLGVLSSIAHPIGREGIYIGTVVHGQIHVAEFRLHADPEVAEMQATIDLARVAGSMATGGDVEMPTFSVNPNGYLMLYVSEGPGGFAVELAIAVKQKAKVVFDSRILNAGDLFIATLIRPGQYQASNTKVRGKASILVKPPPIRKKPFRPPSPARIKCSKKGFDPRDTSVLAAQGVIFEIEVPSAIEIDLTKAAREEPHKGLRSVRWRASAPYPR